MILAGILGATIVLLGWKISTISKIYRDGYETVATINNIGFHKSRGQIIFIYDYQGERYISRNVVMKNKITKRYDIGDRVLVLIDGGNPKRAYIKELFLK